MAYEAYGRTDEAESPASPYPQDGEKFYDVGILRQQYREFVDIKSREISERKQARRYYHSDQWTHSQLKELRKRHQNPITKNRIQRKIDGMVGVLQRLRQDPKGFPRTPVEEQRGGAELATATIRFVLDDQDWKSLEAESARLAMIDGIGGVERILKYNRNGEVDITLQTVEADTFFYDPKSVRHDFSDARYMGIAKTVDLGLAIEMFPDKARELRDYASRGGGADEFFFHSDREKLWAHSNAQRLALIDHWYICEGRWCWCVYIGDVKVDEGVSPHIDEDGNSESKFLMFSANVDHDGDRYGYVRILKSPQDEVNHISSKMLYLIAANRVIADKGATDNPERTRVEASRPDGFIEKNPGKELKFADKSTDFAGLNNMLQQNITEIENIGPNPAVLGQGIENKSGRAIHLLQQAGVAEMGPFLVSYEGWHFRVYRGLFNDIRNYWTTRRIIRITDSDDLVQFVELNGVDIDEMGAPALVNAIGELDVDIKLDRGPDVVNMMADTHEMLMQALQSGMQIPPQILIRLWPGLPSDVKQEILESLEPKPNPGMEEAKKVALDVEKAKATKDQSQAFKNVAQGVETIVNSPAAAAAMLSRNGVMPGGPQMMPPQAPMPMAPPPQMPQGLMPQAQPPPMGQPDPSQFNPLPPWMPNEQPMQPGSPF